MPDNSTAIAEIETQLNAAVTSTAVDGTSVSIDIKELRRRLAELKATDTSQTHALVRPKVLRITLD